jgi:hypothetical protein
MLIEIQQLLLQIFYNNMITQIKGAISVQPIFMAKENGKQITALGLAFCFQLQYFPLFVCDPKKWLEIFFFFFSVFGLHGKLLNIFLYFHII